MSKREVDLEDATQHEEVNPMAPNSGTTESQPDSRQRSQLRLKAKHKDTPQLGSPATKRPSFTVAAPGQQFGFRIPSTDRYDAEDADPSSGSSTRPGSVFSGGVPRTSTAPTSRAASVCSSGLNGQEDTSRRRSSHLQMLALASQSGLGAPTRLSRVSSSIKACNHPVFGYRAFNMFYPVRVVLVRENLALLLVGHSSFNTAIFTFPFRRTRWAPRDAPSSLKGRQL